MDSTSSYTETPFVDIWNTTMTSQYGPTVTQILDDRDYNNSWEFSNTTASSDSSPHSTVAAVFIYLVAFILMVSTVGGNLLVIIAYHKNRRLRSVNNLFLVSLACSDLVIGLVSMNLYPVMIVLDGWYLGPIACDIWLCIDYTLSMASVANLMLICLDRYFSVTCPFKYRPKRTRPVAKIAIILAWIISMLLWAPAIVIWPIMHGRKSKSTECQIEFFQNSIITLVTAVIAFYLPVIIMIILYWRIFKETKRCRQYMDYLRSYNTSQSSGSSKSPFTKRKSKPQRNSGNSRDRINSSPASEFADAAKIWKPDPVSERPDESDESRCNARNSNEDEIEELTKTLRNETPLNNNSKASEEFPPVLARFQRFTRSLTDSIRNSIKSGTDCSVSDTSKSASGRSNTAETYPTKTHNRACSDPASESQSLLVSEGVNGVSSPTGTQRTFTVPTIVTSSQGDSDQAQSTHRPARRAMSEADTLSVPSAKRPTRPVSSAGESTVGPSKIPASDRKAAKTLSAILIAFVCTWLPYNVMVIYSSFCIANDCDSHIPQPAWYFAYYLCYINSTLNPFCYAACNKTFRDTFIRLLTCRKRGYQRPANECCWFRRGKNRRDTRTTDTVTMHPSTSSSKSLPPSPLPNKRRTFNS